MKTIAIIFSIILFFASFIPNMNAQVKDDFITDLNSPTFSVAILVSPCSDGGSSLLVYNPSAKSADSLGSGEFSVSWVYSSGNIFLGHKILLSCVCNGSYTAIVTHLESGTQQSITVNVSPCESLHSNYKDENNYR